jgi:3-phenylpropionate/trans-cinnamate dioxygenase ferredoxin reductase subunit
LRTLDDAIRLRGVLRPGKRLVVLGAGLIGQEVAATAIGHGAEVTLIEAEPLPLARALHPELAQWLVDLQRVEGVEVKLGARVTELIGDGDRLQALLLDDGSRVELDEMLVAIGVIPNSDWLPDEIGLLTARPDIHGAGDVAGGDHWELAAHQGKAVAHAILGQEPAPVPFTGWWSDVHSVRLQGLGQPAANDEIVFEGNPAERDFHAVVSRDGVPVAALAVGQPREIPRLRKLLAEHASTQPAKEAA